MFTSSGSGGGCDLISPSKAEILSNIYDLLCFCVHQHTYRIKCNFLKTNVMEKVLCLTRRRKRFLVVATVRFMLAVISQNICFIFFYYFHKLVVVHMII
ncbi:hypothetical protein KSP39_PZI011533 [Platanthera zijinensis]|uniref:Serine/threonine-protein phosphatase 4 regulatory subunit 3-like central domain-containing protein n=1 Tax=Platanthera zijinensis TaxID=2320716 RepID=A0AAP0BG76_9ASPA